MLSLNQKSLRMTIFQLELYEVLGLVVSVVTVVVFFVKANALQAAIGIPVSNHAFINNLAGLFTERLTAVFVLTLFALFFLFLYARQPRIQRAIPNAAFVLRILISFVTMMIIYKAVNFYIVVFHPAIQDAALQQIDRALFFGKLPSQWLEPMISHPMTLFLGISYLTWFALTYLTILLLLTHSRKAVQEYVFTSIYTFYIGYLTYMFVPAIGPTFTVHYPQPLGSITAILVSNDVHIARDCFPSLHTGISLVMLIFVYRYRKKWLWIYAPWTAIIVFSTLYLRIHYGIDVIAGAALAFTTCQLGPLYVKMWSSWRSALSYRSARRGTPADVPKDVRSELA